ncbi:MAG: hypothetical protein WC280_00400 [Patescibacteria group bacterium]
MNSNFFFYFTKLSVQFILDLLYFPVWWYSVGFIRFVKLLGLFLRDRWTMIGAGVWIRNIFVPMYGQRDFTSRTISFLVRLFQIIFRLIFFLIFSAIVLALIASWLALPVVLAYIIINKVS